MKAQCNSRLGNSPGGNMLIIENEWLEGIKQDGKAEAPWILIATASREAKKGLLEYSRKVSLGELAVYCMRK